MTNGYTTVLWPLLLYFALVLVVVIGMLGLSYILGQHHQERATNQPFESGILPTGSARLRIPAQFYLVSILFVIFDLEAIFLVAWAIALRSVGWVGYVGALVFIGVLVAGLLYEWRMGALDWNKRKPYQVR